MFVLISNSIEIILFLYIVINYCPGNEKLCLIYINIVKILIWLLCFTLQPNQILLSYLYIHE